MLKEMPKIAVLCKTQEEYDYTQKLRQKAGWLPLSQNYWPQYKENTCVNFDCCTSPSFASRDFYIKKHITVISLPEFLREQGISEELKVGDWVEITEDFTQSNQCFDKGEKYQVSDYCEGQREYNLFALDVSWRSGNWGDHQSSELHKRNWIIDREHKNKFRKCSPPEEVKNRGEDYCSEAPKQLQFIGDKRMIRLGYCSDCEMTVPAGGHPCRLLKPTSPSFMDNCTSVFRKARALALSPMERKYRKLGLKDADGLTDEGQKVFIDLLFEKYGKEIMDPRVKDLCKKEVDEE